MRTPNRTEVSVYVTQDTYRMSLLINKYLSTTNSIIFTAGVMQLWPQIRAFVHGLSKEEQESLVGIINDRPENNTPSPDEG